MPTRLWKGILAGIGLLLMILDGKTGIYAASEGVRICFQTLIPSLFPFFFLSIVLTSFLSGSSYQFLRPLGKLCRIPAGAEILLINGLLGGYPAGAQGITQAYEAGHLSKRQAERLLGFCSNAGPSFLFGIIASRFSHLRIAWVLWLIHILSAIITGILLPGNADGPAVMTSPRQMAIPQALNKSITIMAQICGWVIICRVLIQFLERWILWIIPVWLQVTITGFLELANGCCLLNAIPEEGTRFLICSGMLAFGGICVVMQTMSVTNKLGLGMYLPGKLIQTGISLILSYFAQFFLFHTSDRLVIHPWMITVSILCILIPPIYFLWKEKNSSIPGKIGV